MSGLEIEKENENLPRRAHSVHTFAKLVISRRERDENGTEMRKNYKGTCKACKTTVFLCLY